MGFLDNIKKGQSGRRGSNPDKTKYWGTLSPAAIACMCTTSDPVERKKAGIDPRIKVVGGKGREALVLKEINQLRASGMKMSSLTRVLTYHAQEDVPESGKDQYSQFNLAYPESWSEMIQGEALEAAGRGAEAKFLPYDVEKASHATFRPIKDGMNSEEAFGDAFTEGLALALKAEPELVHALLVANGRIESDKESDEE